MVIVCMGDFASGVINEQKIIVVLRDPAVIRGKWEVSGFIYSSGRRAWPWRQSAEAAAPLNSLAGNS